ncbi:hypothetical protein MS3_00009301 [Schistosoma haematobium]|uniref:Uncharacterized protein n=1 Tax=Schistosoma haematobium TaxID=6185 RepID=A0A922IJC0_SCHHA|nr:hypothetical protein MS3_00009301 [Schistosoma haematobium]KAH9580751.1 hypothetical protein MS3_00009301 [Schistosoma haematobium]
MTEDQFKCLVFICSLQSLEDADMRTKILSKIKQCPNITLHEVNLKHDISMIKNSDDGLKKKKHNQSQPVTGRESLCNYSEQSAYKIVVIVIIVIVFRDY